MLKNTTYRLEYCWIRICVTYAADATCEALSWLLRCRHFTHKQSLRYCCGVVALIIISSLYYSASALLEMHSDVLATAILSARLPFRHVPVLCPDEGRYDRVVFSIW